MASQATKSGPGNWDSCRTASQSSSRSPEGASPPGPVSYDNRDRQAKRNLSWLLASLLSLPSVLAASRFIPDAVERAFSDIFIILPEGFRNASFGALIFFKMLFFILTYAVLLYGTKKVVDKKNIAAAIAFILALASTMLLPNSMVTAIFITWSGVIGILAGLAPILVGLWIRPKAHEYHQLMCVIWLLIGLVSFTAGGYFNEASNHTNVVYEQQLYGWTGQWTMLGGVAAFLAGIFCFFMPHGGGKGGGSGGGGGEGGGGDGGGGGGGGGEPEEEHHPHLEVAPPRIELRCEEGPEGALPLQFTVKNTTANTSMRWEAAGAHAPRITFTYPYTRTKNR